MVKYESMPSIMDKERCTESIDDGHDPELDCGNDHFVPGEGGPYQVFQCRRIMQLRPKLVSLGAHVHVWVSLYILIGSAGTELKTKNSCKKPLNPKSISITCIYWFSSEGYLQLNGKGPSNHLVFILIFCYFFKAEYY